MFDIYFMISILTVCLFCVIQALCLYFIGV